MLSGAKHTRPELHEARIQREQRAQGFGRRLIDVDVVSAADLLRQHNMPVVDFASVDVEGFELQALTGLLAPGITVRALAVENNYCEREVPALLRQHGYVRLTTAGEDDIWRLRSECGPREWVLALLGTAALVARPEATPQSAAT